MTNLGLFPILPRDIQIKLSFLKLTVLLHDQNSQDKFEFFKNLGNLLYKYVTFLKKNKVEKYHSVKKSFSKRYEKTFLIKEIQRMQ